MLVNLRLNLGSASDYLEVSSLILSFLSCKMEILKSTAWYINSMFINP